MKNTTVKELIEILEKMNPEAVVCHYDFEYDEYSTFEICREVREASYIDDAGDTQTGDIVAIF